MGTFLVVEDGDTIVEIVTFDVTIAEDHEQVSVATENPIEDGSTITDHVIPGPKRLSVEVVVSNHPIRPRLGIVDGDTASFNGGFESVKLNLPPPFLVPSGFFIPTPGFLTRSVIAAVEGRLSAPDVSAKVLKFEPFDAVTETYEKLQSLQDTGSIIRVVTSLREYENMVITRVNSPKTVNEGTGGRFVIDFQQVTKVTAETVVAPVDPAELRGQPGKQRGGKGAKAVNNLQAEQRKKSAALQLLQKAGLVGSTLQDNIGGNL